MEKTEPVIPALPREHNFPLPQIPVLQPLAVHTGTIGVPVMPPRPPLPVPVPIRIDSSAQTTKAPRVSISTQTVRKRRSVASVQTSNHGEEKSVQVEAPTPVAVPRIIFIPITEEEPKREQPGSPKIIVLPSVPTTEPVAPKPAAVPVPIPPRPDTISLNIPVILTAMQPMIVKVPSPEAVPSPIIQRSPSPSVIIQIPSEPVPAAPLAAPEFEPEMTQTITQPASLFSNFIASRPALEPIALSAAFVEDMNVADGTAFPPGAEFIKCWKMINDGRRDWPAETTLVFVGGHRMAAFADAPNSYDVGKAAVGQTVDVWAGDLKAPEEPGVYNSFWRLRDAEKEFFGHRLWINIEVAAPSHSGSDITSHHSLSSSELTMPGRFYEAPQYASVPASEQAAPTAITRRDTVASSSVVTPVTFSSSHSDDSVSLLNDSDRDDGSLVDVPAATTTSTTAGTMATARAASPRAASPTAEDDEWAVVYDSASSVGH